MKTGIGLAVTLILFACGFLAGSPEAQATTPAPFLQAQTETDEPAESGNYQLIADTLFEKLETEGAKEALTYAFSTNPYSALIEDELNDVIRQYTVAERRMGNYLDHVLLVETVVAERVVVQYYLVVYERQPLKFELAFYRPGDEWVFQNFVFSDVLDEVVAINQQALAESIQVVTGPK